MADNDDAATEAEVAQVALCAEVTAKLPKAASADEAAALCTRLAILLVKENELYFGTDAAQGLSRALAASQRVHAAHAGMQEAAAILVFWLYVEWPRGSPERADMLDSLLAAAQTHPGVASLQRRIWETWREIAQVTSDIDEDESLLCDIMQRAFDPLVAALRVHVADVKVVKACVNCLACMEDLKECAVVGALEVAMFTAYEMHVGDVANAHVVWRGLQVLLSLSEVEQDAPVLDAVYAIVLPALASQQLPEAVQGIALQIVGSLAEEKYAGLDCRRLLNLLLPVIQNERSALHFVCEALSAVESVVAHPAAPPLSADEVATLLCALKRKNNGHGYVTGIACLCLAAVVKSGAANAALVAATDAFDTALLVLETITEDFQVQSFAAKLVASLLSLRTMKHTGTAVEVTLRVVRVACAAILAQSALCLDDACCSSCLEVLLLCASRPGVTVVVNTMIGAAVFVLSDSGLIAGSRKRGHTLAHASALLARLLSLQSGDARACAVHNGALATLVHAMTVHADHARLQQHACMACKCLCAPPPPSDEAAAVIDAVSTALIKHAGSSRIMCMCSASLLGDLAGAVGDAVASAQWRAALAAVTAAMRALPGDEVVLKHGCAAVSKLVALAVPPPHPVDVAAHAELEAARCAVLDAMAACRPRVLPGGLAALSFVQRLLTEHAPLSEAHACIVYSAIDGGVLDTEVERLLSDEMCEMRGAFDVVCSFSRRDPARVADLATPMSGIMCRMMSRCFAMMPHFSRLTDHLTDTVLETLISLLSQPIAWRIAVNRQGGCIPTLIDHLRSVESSPPYYFRRGLDALYLLLCEPGTEQPSEAACLRAEADGVRQLVQLCAGRDEKLGRLLHKFTAAQAAKRESSAAALVAAEVAEAAAREAMAARKRERNRKKKDKGRSAGGTDAPDDDGIASNMVASAEQQAALPATSPPALQPPLVLTPPSPPPPQLPAAPLQPAPPAASPRRMPPPYRPPPSASPAAPLPSSELLLPMLPRTPPAPAAAAASSSDNVWAELLAAQSAQTRALEAQLASAQAQVASLQARLASQLTLADDEADRSCVICMDAARCVALMPCRHLLLCDGVACAAMLGVQPVCPACREPVADTLRLFV